MGQSNANAVRSPRCIALVGPYLSGKTTLLESILERTGAIKRQGSVDQGSSVGDNAPEARNHNMSVEVNVASTTYLDDKFTFIDCPGSIEFRYDTTAALTGVDAAVVVCEPDEKKVPALQLIMKQLEDRGIPHFLFINKIDKSDLHIRDILPMLAPASSTPMVLRQIPIWENDIVTGFVDLALERAHVYREHQPSEVIDLPGDLTDREEEARFSMLETLADYDDKLMEQLLDDIEPPRDRVFDDLSTDLRDGIIVPVLIGSAQNGNGITRLLKALRHEVAFVDQTAEHLEVSERQSCAQIIKTYHTAHGGKLSIARVLKGEFTDGTTVYGKNGQDERIAGVFSMMGQESNKIAKAGPGDTVAFGRLDQVRTGETISTNKDNGGQIGIPVPMSPVYKLAILAKERKDDVKLSSAIGKIIEEDPSLHLDHSQDVNEMVLGGRGEMHLRVVLERLNGKFGIDAELHPRTVPYKETIKKSCEIRGRHKKQSGGHGQFGDIVVDIKPLMRGAGFEFSQSIKGGVVPSNYFSAVEAGVRDYLGKGPLGFPVVDVAVHLKDGSYHAVDSSEQAFRTAGRIAMTEGMPKCAPVLLEPIMAVEIYTPSVATAKINGIVSTRRGQILGFDNREGWQGWDVVQAHMPESELLDIIVEIRSVTAGVGSFSASFDHLSELTGHNADVILNANKEKAA